MLWERLSHDGTVIDDRSTVKFDDDYVVVLKTDEDAVFLLTNDELNEMECNTTGVTTNSPTDKMKKCRLPEELTP